ncbi:RNA-binding domain-containing protein [Nitrosospira multiformis]|uniref:RNA-binding domain-containing protein n=1 Tax=Nitrosospira multiformis TaxID=1231 RepID=UPI0009453426|nr:ATP-binding protein [Nitrosospira multiformis]
MIDLVPAQAAPRIEKLLAARESRTLDFKRVSGKMVGKALETICAFANTEGGILALGVADEKHDNGAARLYGIQENPEALDELGRKLRTQFHPPVEAISLLRLPCALRDGGAGHVVLVRVPRSGKVHSIVDDGTWLRLDTGNREMTAAEIAELSYRRGVNSAESEPVPVDWSLLDTPVWAEFSAARGFNRSRSIIERMAQVGLAEKVAGEWIPRRAAVLLFGDEPGGLLAAHSTRAEVRLVVYQGKAVEAGAKPNMRKPPRTLRGPLSRLIDDTVRSVLDELSRGVELASSGFKARHLYPERVVKEAIVNAIIHRDYRLNREIIVRIFDDRMEVDSPGVFPGAITSANILSAGSRARNPLIVKTLRDFPVPQNFDLNEGVPMMFAEMAHARLYPPQYRQVADANKESVTVTLLNMERPTVWDEVSDWIDRNGPVSNSDICQIAGVDTLKASKMLKAWEDQGVLARLPDRAKRNMAYVKPAQADEQADLLSTMLDNKI